MSEIAPTVVTIKTAKKSAAAQPPAVTFGILPTELGVDCMPQDCAPEQDPGHTRPGSTCKAD